MAGDPLAARDQALAATADQLTQLVGHVRQHLPVCTSYGCAGLRVSLAALCLDPQAQLDLLIAAMIRLARQPDRGPAPDD